MIIWQQDLYRLLQHEHLQIFHLQTWGECDNPRSYERHYDWYTEKEFINIYDVINYLQKLGFNVRVG